MKRKEASPEKVVKYFLLLKFIEIGGFFLLMCFIYLIGTFACGTDILGPNSGLTCNAGFWITIVYGLTGLLWLFLIFIILCGLVYILWNFIALNWKCAKEAANNE